VDTARLQGTLNYAPSVLFHAESSDRNRVDHNLNAQLLGVLLPETLFLDLRAAAGVQSLRGGFAPEGTTTTTRGDRVQTYSFQASPYFVHRFGTLATAQLGYSFQYVDQELGSGTVQPLVGPSFFAPQEFTAHEGYSVVRTGEDFGPLALEGRVSGIAYDGSGVLDGAHRELASVEARYAFTRGIAALVEIGYERQKYGGFPPTDISEPIWSVGVRLAPGPDSVIVAKYGHRDGFDSAFLDAAVSLGARTRLFANYSDRLTTSAQRAVDLLSTTSLDELGNPVDTLTGAPVVLPFTSSFLAAQSSLLRIRRGTASISQTWPRDTVTLSVIYEDEDPVAIARGTVPLAQRGTSGSLTWSHELTPEMSLTAYLQYGVTESRRGDEDVYTAGAALFRTLAPGLTGTLRYTLTNRDLTGAPGRAVQNVLVAGLRQTF
jgi:uncharacterized protein (PEP-CTERM system associated)